jgi:hypothetical protein
MLVRETGIARSSIQPQHKRWLWLIAKIAVALVVVFAVYLFFRLTRDQTVVYRDDGDHFKYGSTGGERASGIPYSIFKAMPTLFPEYLPGKGYQSLGFLYEEGKDLPIGMSRRNFRGVDVVFFNCAICHVGSVRETPHSKPRYIVGMPSNTVNLRGYYEFLFNCAQNQKFTPDRLLLETNHVAVGEDFLNRMIFRYYAVYLIRERLLMLRQRLGFILDEPEFGPGRIDTFSPAKAYFNFRMDKAPDTEKFGVVDLPSIWYQGQRADRRILLHWDGNNISLDERNLSAAFGTGVTPPTLDRASLTRTAEYLKKLSAPPYPFKIDQQRAANGAPIYKEYCADCHGASGRDFSGALVGHVTPIEQIGTDRNRLDNYTFDLAVNQSTMYSGYAWRFSHFRKTFGYVNMPLDGVWARAPFLHNGSVPTLRALLEPSTKRPAVFYRGDDVYDQANVGFESNVAERDGHKFFKLDTTLRANGNWGHEGEAYGTKLTPDEKDALVEYLKTF